MEMRLLNNDSESPEGRSSRSHFGSPSRLSPTASRKSRSRKR